MAIVRVTKDRYTVESLYQWDKNQVLEVYGLSLASIPEIHFTNDATDRAIVRQATMSSAGVISADIPNSLLQKPYKITAYICVYDGDTFESLYKIVIPVKERNRPGDYTLEDNDGEVYSFNALENKIENLIVTLTADTEETVASVNAKCDETVAKVKASNEALERAVGETYDAAVAEVNNKCNTTLETVRDETEEALGSMAKKAASPVAGNFAGLDAAGNVTNSGKNPSDFAAANENLLQYTNNKLRTLGGKVVESSRTSSGSYTGTKVYGADNPTSLTFDFEPKLVFIHSSYGVSVYLWGTTDFELEYGANGKKKNTVTTTANGDGTYTMSWYNTESAAIQLNQYTHQYAAVG